MHKEKSNESKQPVREIEAHHFNPGPSGEIDSDFFETNKKALEMAIELLSLKGTHAKLTIGRDFENCPMALVKDSKGEIIFSTTLPTEIDELIDAAHNASR